MKAIKHLGFLAGILCSAALFADEGATLISFSTEADTYADGKSVIDGEWYALVWSQDGAFEGINLDCTPVDANDEIVYVSPLATNGHCPDVVFVIPTAKARANGVYAVYLLDTRDASGETVAAANGSKRPAINGAVVSKNFSVEGGVGLVKATETAVQGEAEWTASSVDETKIANYEPAKISAIKVENAKVKITVSNMLPGLKYNMRMGSEPDKLQTLALPTPKTASDPVFVLDQGDAKFFKVVRQPLDNK